MSIQNNISNICVNASKGPMFSWVVVLVLFLLYRTRPGFMIWKMTFGQRCLLCPDLGMSILVDIMVRTTIL